MFLHAVFNEGRIETVHKSFPAGFVRWLKAPDHIFTTNYDSNLDVAADSEVHHLHGAFRIVSEAYDPTSFRNQLQDDLLDGEEVDEAYPHLYSNCLVSYVGDLKAHSMTESSLANSAMDKFVSGYRTILRFDSRSKKWTKATCWLNG